MANNLIGTRFGRLLVIADAPRNLNNPNARYVVQCDCGATKTVFGYWIKTRKPVSCGCIREEALRAAGKKVEVGFISGSLIVISQLNSIGHGYRWLVRCECGIEKVMRSDWLSNRRVISCGCIKAQAMSERMRTHGMSRTKEYDAWCNLKARCLKPKNKEYFRYGGRGIKVCDRWKNSFENFLEDMGFAPAGYEIDRRDVNGNYDPSNCHWVPYIAQMRNMRTTKLSMEKARMIRKMRLEGIPYSEIRKEFKISDASISAVVLNKIWKEGLV